MTELRKLTGPLHETVEVDLVSMFWSSEPAYWHTLTYNEKAAMELIDVAVDHYLEANGGRLTINTTPREFTGFGSVILRRHMNRIMVDAVFAQMDDEDNITSVGKTLYYGFDDPFRFTKIMSDIAFVENRLTKLLALET